MERKDLQTEKRPDEETEGAEHQPGRNAAEEINEQCRSHEMVGKLHVVERPAGAPGEANPKADCADQSASRGAQPLGHGAVGQGPKEAGNKRNRAQGREYPKNWPVRGMTAKDAFDEDGVSDQGDGIGNDIKNLEPAKTEAQGRKRGKKESGADLYAGLAECGKPGMGAIGKVPGPQMVEENHADDHEQEAEEPEQGARVAKAEIEIPEGRDQEYSEDEGRNLGQVEHGEPSVSLSLHEVRLNSFDSCWNQLDIHLNDQPENN